MSGFSVMVTTAFGRPGVALIILAADAVKISIESMRVGRVDGEAPIGDVTTVEIRR